MFEEKTKSKLDQVEFNKSNLDQKELISNLVEVNSKSYGYGEEIKLDSNLDEVHPRPREHFTRYSEA